MLNRPSSATGANRVLAEREINGALLPVVSAQVHLNDLPYIFTDADTQALSAFLDRLL